MADIRCPMCGKPNSDHLEICQHCQARLKPLVISSTPDDQSSSPPEGADKGLPDWLQSDEQDDAVFEEQAEGEDWLKQLRVEDETDHQEKTSLEGSSPDQGEPEGELWLDRIRQLNTDESNNIEDPASDAGIPDWMPPEEPEQPAESASAPADDGIPDWLKSPQEPEFDFSADSPKSESKAKLSGLLARDDETDEADMRPEIPDIPVTTPEEETDLGWLGAETPAAELDADLADLFAADGADAPPEISDTPTVASEADEADLPDWLNTPGVETPAAELDADLADLFAGDGADAPPEISDTLTGASEAEEADLPDWLNTPGVETPAAELDADLADLFAADGADAPPEISDTLTGASEANEADLPDWLTDASAETPDSTLDDPALPDWLNTPGVETPAAELDADLAKLFASAGEDDDADTPSEISDFISQSPATTPEAELSDDSDGIPDWLSGLDDEDVEIPIILPDADPETPGWAPEDATKLSWSEKTIGQDTEPDWLQKFDGDEFAQDDEISSPSFAKDSEEDLLEIEGLSELFGETGDGFEKAGVSASDDDDLTPAELPGWLEAMRPVEPSGDSSTDEQRGLEVQTGPLAGLSGVLRAEPEIAQLKKSGTVSTKLQVTEAQQDKVKLLRDLLETEGNLTPIPPAPKTPAQGVLRSLIAFALIFVVIITIFTESQTAPPTPQESIPVEVLNTSEMINSLASQDAVLIAFDYEPGMAGEMEAAAAAVVDHLMIKGAYLSLISTSPTGPALAERFIRTIQKEHNYTSGIQYINLGFIPGGAAGLLGFAQMPQRISPLSFDGMDAWSTAPLNGIYTLADFKLVVLISDNPDSARTWIEQVQPKLQDTPLIAVVSAQAEPLIKPYSGGTNAQIQGVVAGIIDGAAYEQITGKPKLAHEYWDALNYALITAISIILLGGIANGAAVLIKKKKPGVTK
jgi:hypothetical protein